MQFNIPFQRVPLNLKIAVDARNNLRSWNRTPTSRLEKVEREDNVGESDWLGLITIPSLCQLAKFLEAPQHIGSPRLVGFNYNPIGIR